jgi:muramoyltetrapeptide carboxypeptidase
MKRKHFIGSTLSLIAGTSVFGKSFVDIPEPPSEDQHTIKIPTYLKHGDKIGITSPAGYIAIEAIQSAVNKLQSWGYQTVIGDTIGKRNFTFGGTDEERRADFQNMLDDDSIKAIMCARGGYGLVRIIDQLNFEHFKKHPKWIIGFSDATILHAHIHSNYKTASIHSKMCNSFPSDWSVAEAEQIASLESIDQALKGKALKYHIKPNANNRVGRATGTLVGGNLKIIETLCGSGSELDTAGKMLFLEDTDEYLYSIDRMFWSLKRSGKLDKLKGLVIGGFKIKPDDPGDEFGLTLEQIVLEKVGAYEFPVCFGFPVGHQKHNVALICGTKFELEVSPDGANLLSH